jgi:FkbM family methyltransferase
MHDFILNEYKMKTLVQDFLKSIGLYQRVKTSFLYDLYWRFADAQLIENRRKEIEFYRKLLGNVFTDGDIIFDVGANHGAKTEIFLALGAKVVAVEPDELNKRVLQEKFYSLRITKKPVTIIDKAVSDSNATTTMWIDEPGSAKNTLSLKWVNTLRHDDRRFGKRLGFSQQRNVETITLDSMIEQFGLPVFIKIDVEGFEPQVLSGLSRAVHCISFEVNLPEFRPEGIECIKILEQIDYTGMFNYAVDCSEGLALPEWLPPSQFIDVLSKCSAQSIEIFYKNQVVP